MSNDDQIDRKKRIREDLAELKSSALAKLEQLGYDVRGKTPRQIRQLLRRRPSKQNLKVADRQQTQGRG